MVDNVSTSESGVATMSPMGSSGTDATPTSPNIFDVTVNRYGFDYPVFDKENVDRIDVDASDNDDETNIESNDEENV